MIHTSLKSDTGGYRYNLILYSLYVLFSYLSESTLFPSLLVTICLYGFILCVLMSILVSKKLIINNHNKWWVVFTCLSVVSYIVSGMRTLQAVEKVVIILVLVICLSYTIKSKEDILLVAKVYTISAAMLVVALMVTGQLFTTNRLGFDILGNANSFSNKMLFPCIIGVWLLIYENNKAKKWIYCICFVFILLAIGLSGGRKIAIAVGICVIYLYYTNGKNNPFNKMRNILIAGIIILGAIYAMQKIPALYNSIGIRFFNRSNRVIESDQSRLLYISLGLKGWLNKPLFGHGIDTFKFYNGLVTGAMHYSHNNYVELLFDYGIIGFGTYYYFIIVCISRLRRLPEELKSYKTLGLCVVLALITFDFGGISYYTNTNQIMLLVAYLITIVPFFK